MLPNVLQPREADHVPVLAEEVRAGLAVRPGETVIDATFGAGGHAALLAADLARQREADRDRPRPGGAHVLRAAREARRRVNARLLRGDFGVVLPQLAGNGVRADAILLDLGVSSMQLDRPERGFSYAVDAPLDMRMDPTQEESARDLVNTWSERDLMTIFRRYGEERYAKQIARAIVRRRREQPFERTGELVDTIKCAIPAPARFGEGHPAKRVFQALRIAVNGELDSLAERAARRARDAPARRPPRGDLLPLARGPDRQAVPPRARARLHVPARLPGLRLRARAGAARAAAAADPARARRSSRRTRAPRRRACASRSRPRRRRPRWRPSTGSRPRRSPSRPRGAACGAQPTAAPAARRARRKRTQRRVRAPHRLDDSLRAPPRRRRRASTSPSCARTSRSNDLDEQIARARRPGTRRSRPQLSAIDGGAAHRGGGAPAGLDSGVGRRHVVRSTCAPRSEPLKRAVVNSRLRLLFLIIVLTFAVLGARAAWIQTVRASSLAAMAHGADEEDGRRCRPGAARSTTGMGNPLAIGAAGDRRRSPTRCRSPIRAARRGSRRRCSGSASGRCPALSDRSRSFVYVQRKAPPAKAAALEKRNLTGFTFQPDQQRVYPQGTVAAPVLGYMGIDNSGSEGSRPSSNNELAGTAGQARRSSATRSARPSTRSSRRAGRERQGRLPHARQPHPGERRADPRADGAASGTRRTRRRSCMDPRTGAILAMAQEPGYNANGFPQAFAHGLTVDHAINDVFEPGSVFKVVTIGGALSAARHHAEHGVPRPGLAAASPTA